MLGTSEIRPDVFARRLRRDTIRMVAAAKASHLGGCLSMADILSVLYTRVLRVDPDSPRASDRDRFILSKGHAAAILYAALAARGFFSPTLLEGYGRGGSILTGHVSHAVPGVEVSTGSLGHGLPLALGMAIAARAQGRRSRVYCLLSDGECDEGSNWEAALFAAHHKLDNVVAIIDYNKIQSFGRISEVLGLEPFVDKWRAFGWSTLEIDGHDLASIESAFAKAAGTAGLPTVVLAHTIKGRGVSFMEDKLEWHYRSPDEAQLLQALAEVGTE